MGYGAFAYIGSKGNLAERIIQIMPPHNIFIEVFGGSGAVLISRNPPAPVEIYNDINSDIVNFMLQIRDNLVPLKQYLSFTPYSRELYEQYLYEWRQGKKPHDNMERAARWFYLQCASTNQRFGGGWRHSKIKNIAQEYYMCADRLVVIARRLRNVQIEQKDFRELIPIYDSEESLFYLDPPYNIRASSSSGTYYGVEFSEENHRDLAEILSQTQGKAIVSYYPSTLIDELYANWQRLEIKVIQGSGDVRGGGKKRVTELLLCNFEPLPLFRNSQLVNRKGDT